MNTFNIQRFLQTVKWTELTLLQRTIRQAIIVTIAFLIITLLFTEVFTTVEEDGVVASMNGTGSFLMILSLAYFISFGALTLSDMKRNQDRIFLLMLPASNAEKFWARVLHATVGTLLVCLVAIVAADALQALIHLISRTPTASLTVSALSYVTVDFFVGDADLECAGKAVVVLLFLWMQSVYVLGGMFFRKSQWILVTLIGIAVTILASTCITFVSISLARSGAFDGYVLDLYASAYITIVVLAALIALNYWLAYKIFSRIQLINNKWINV